LMKIINFTIILLLLYYYIIIIILLLLKLHLYIFHLKVGLFKISFHT